MQKALGKTPQEAFAEDEAKKSRACMTSMLWLDLLPLEEKDARSSA